MSKVEVLVAALGKQNDDSLYKKMNLKTDAVIANQCDTFGYYEYSINSKSLKIIATKDNGVGKNRNTAILNSSGDILVFADEDMVYKDNYEDIILNAFAAIPDADMIVFDTNTIPDPGDCIHIFKTKRLSIINALKYGASRMAARRASLLKANVWFSLLFGGGARYCSGEDTIFIKDCIKKGLRVYTYPEIIADVYQQKSTWFKGYNEKYFSDRGSLLAALFPKTCKIFAIYFAFRYKDRTKLSAAKIYKLLLDGIKDFKNYRQEE